MKKIYSLLVILLAMTSSQPVAAQGWPSDYDGVMLQAFYWDSFTPSQWRTLEAQAGDISSYFSLVWVPQSGRTGNTLSMGYDPLYWYDQNSSFGNEAELKSMIQTYKSLGTGVIADVVINHRSNVSNWVDFPKETNPWDGKTYQMYSTDICRDDDGGATLNWANNNGYQLSANNDTGEGWGGMRDLDHKSQNVQDNCKAYLKYLLNYLGYTGFRYDMVKGYSGSYTGLYNTDCGVAYSVGECWDGTNTIKNWIEATRTNGEIQSAAFDFQFRYTVRNAINRNDWTQLGKQNEGNWPLMSSNYQNGAYRRYAITFVENHDTERRSNAAQDPIVRDTLAANAYLLAMPGTPCVFMTHWLDCKKDIKMMINARKAAGINSLSNYANFANNTGYYAVKVDGTKTSLLAVVGNNADAYAPNQNFQRILSGHHYAYYMLKSAEQAWVDLPSGSYDGAQTATLTAVSTNDNARIVYTTDGSDPTPQSTQAVSGTTINLAPGNTTLKAALLVNGAVGAIITRQYNITNFEPYDFTAYVNTDAVGWSFVNFWSWGGDNSHSPANKNWPGDKVTSTVSIDGKNWFAKTYRINSITDEVNFVFSTNSGSPQTVDVNGIKNDTFFEISAETESGKNKVNIITTDIKPTIANEAAPSADIYSIDGRLIRRGTPGTTPQQMTQGLPTGIYIMGGRKLIINN
ncbi:MAG: chitobiase/beta-hexosaminidase C-terminal domain-containing protein [Prevotella sp.]|nr:chitobiase/beta-hexosaminidase C-terminal domain-containing protein [Prevotella sp.]